MDGLAHKIRYARRHNNLSQKKLGQKLGLSKMAISAYETGRAVPPWPTLKKISDITNFPLAYFTGENTKQVTLEDISREMATIKKDVSRILEHLLKKK